MLNSSRAGKIPLVCLTSFEELCSVGFLPLGVTSISDWEGLPQGRDSNAVSDALKREFEACFRRMQIGFDGKTSAMRLVLVFS